LFVPTFNDTSSMETEHVKEYNSNEI
jgi:hypothetical protein